MTTHSLSGFVSSKAPGGLWTASPVRSQSPYCEPSSLLGNVSLEWIPQQGCVGCSQEQNENHFNQDQWWLKDTVSGEQYFGANPFPESESYFGLPQQLRHMLQFNRSLEWWTNGDWTIYMNGRWFLSILYNAEGPDGSFWPNFMDGGYAPVIGASGKTITIDTSVAAGVRDPRGWYFNNEPMAVGDTVAIFGNNCCIGTCDKAHIEDMEGLSAIGGDYHYYTRPNTLDLILDKTVTPGISLARILSSAQSAWVWIGKEYKYPPDIPEIIDPSYFYGVYREVEYDVNDLQWESGSFTLKNATGGDCVVAAPYQMTPHRKTFVVEKKDAITQEWVDLQVSLSSSLNRRTVMGVKNGSTRFSLLPYTWLNVYFAKSVTGLLLTDFTATAGITLSDLSIVTGGGTQWKLKATVDNTALSPQTFRVDLPYGVRTESDGTPTHAARVVLEYDQTRPLTWTYSNNSIINSEKAISCGVIFADARTNRIDIRRFEETDVSVTQCILANFGGAGSAYSFDLIPTGAYPSFSIGDQVCESVFGRTNIGPNGVQFQWTPPLVLSAPHNCYIPEPIIYQEGPSIIDLATTLYLYFRLIWHHGREVQLLSANDFSVTNGTATGLSKISASEYRLTVRTGNLQDEGSITVYLPSGACYDWYYGPSEPPDWPPEDPYPGGLVNNASNTIQVYFYRNKPTPILSIDLDGLSLATVAGIGTCRFNREMFGNFETFKSSMVLTGGDVLNIDGLSSDFSFLVACPTVRSYSMNVAASVLQDRANKYNTVSNTEAWKTTAMPSPGTGLATDKRLYVTHPKGCVDWSSANTKFHSRGTVNGVSGYEDLLFGADAIRFKYYWATSPTDYASKPEIVHSARCDKCKRDMGNVWGFPGINDGKWFCSMRNAIPTPEGLDYFGAGYCYLIGTCSYFAPLTWSDFLTPGFLASILQALWIGVPGGLMQISPGSSSHNNFRLKRYSRASITSHVTALEEMTYTNQYTPYWLPLGSGAFGEYYEEDFAQGLAHLRAEHVAQEWTSPIDSSNRPPDGVIPRNAPAGWKTKSQQLELATLNDSTDPYGEFRNFPFCNAWASERQSQFPIGGDIGPFRYMKRMYGNDTSEQIFIPNIPAEIGLFVKRDGGIELGGWKADKTRCNILAPDCVYGAMLRFLPEPYTTDTGLTLITGTIRAISAISGGYEIICEPAIQSGMYSQVIPGYGPVQYFVYFYYGGNIVGSPEWARNNNPGDYSVFHNSLGPHKGVREGHTLAFLNNYETAWEFTWPIGGDPGLEVETYEVTYAKGYGGTRVSWQDGGPYKGTSDDTYYNSYIANCTKRPHAEIDWGSKCDVIRIADPDGHLAGRIAAGQVGVGKHFGVYNYSATFGHNWTLPTLWWSHYGSDDWAQIGSENIVWLDRVIGLCFLKKEIVLETIWAAAQPVCIRANASKGRYSHAGIVNPRDINDTLMAQSCLTTVIDMEPMTSRTPVLAGFRYMGTCRFTQPDAKYFGDPGDLDSAIWECKLAIEAKGREIIPTSLFGQTPYEWTVDEKVNAAWGNPFMWLDRNNKHTPPVGPGGITLYSIASPFEGGGLLVTNSRFQANGPDLPSYAYYVGPDYWVGDFNEPDPWYDLGDELEWNNAEAIAYNAPTPASSPAFVCRSLIDPFSYIHFAIGGVFGYQVFHEGYRYSLFNQSALEYTSLVLPRLPDDIEIVSAHVKLKVTLGTYIEWKERVYFSEVVAGDFRVWGNWHCNEPQLPTGGWDSIWRSNNYYRKNGFFTPVWGPDPIAPYLTLENGHTIGDDYGYEGDVPGTRRTNPIGPYVKIGMIGFRPNGSHDFLGVTASVRGYYQGDPLAKFEPVEYTDAAKKFYSNRVAGYTGFGFVVIGDWAQDDADLSDSFGTPDVYPIPNFPYGNDPNPFPNQCIFPVRVDFPCVIITNTLIQSEKGVIRFKYTAPNSTYGVGPATRLPHFI